MGDGKRISFWKDNWIREGDLKTLFPRLYSLATNKGAMLFEIAPNTAVHGWNIQFRRRLLVWEEVEADRLYSKLQQLYTLVNDRADYLHWE